MTYKQFRDIRVSALGMGNMRLPLVDPNDSAAIDYPEAHKIIDLAYEQGINYFDTAYVYNKGDSEKCVGEAMKKYPRDSFYLATKYYFGVNPDYAAVFEEQLQRLQTDHIDFYLIHCITDDTAEQNLQSGAIEYFLEKQAEGKIRYLGFSSHASPKILEKFASHHDWDFVQIQLNYYDWCFRTAKAEYEILERKNIPVIVMEPVRGGALAKLTPDAERMLQIAHPEWSIASWAFRFVKRLPMVKVILSGMSNLEQVDDNLDTFSDEDGLSDSDLDILMKACALFKDQIQVPCTSCRYCCDGCPAEINIPEFMKLYNDYRIDGSEAMELAKSIESVGKPADCLECGACAEHCPQKIGIPEIMKKLADLMD